MYEIYLTLRAILKGYVRDNTKNINFIQGFSECLTLMEIALKKSGVINMHVENRRLKRELERVIDEYKKKINKLEIELDNNAEDITVLKKMLSRAAEVKVEEIDNMRIAEVQINNMNFKFLTEATEEFVKENIQDALIKTLKSKGNMSYDYLLGSFLNYFNAKGFKSKKIR